MTSASHVDHHSHPPHLRHVPFLRPFHWISQGWEDLIHHPAGSLAYGALVSVLGILILAYSQHPLFIAAAMSAFMLVGPIMAAGLCELSRQRSMGHTSDFEISLKTLRGHKQTLLRYGGALFALSLLWFAVSSAMLYQAFGSVAPSVEEAIWGDVFRNLSVMQIMSYVVIGAALATVVFILSVVTVPMIIDREADAAEAMLTSVRVTLAADLPAMMVWGLICTAMVAIGFATFLTGMIIIFPLLGHATWYAYQDLVEDD